MALTITLTNISPPGTHADYEYVVSVNRDVIEHGQVLGHNRSEGWPALLAQLLDQRRADREYEKKLRASF